MPKRRGKRKYLIEELMFENGGTLTQLEISKYVASMLSPSELVRVGRRYREAQKRHNNGNTTLSETDEDLLVYGLKSQTLNIMRNKSTLGSVKRREGRGMSTIWELTQEEFEFQREKHLI